MRRVHRWFSRRLHVGETGVLGTKIADCCIEMKADRLSKEVCGRRFLKDMAKRLVVKSEEASPALVAVLSPVSRATSGNFCARKF